jgi:hypothetical protein
METLRQKKSQISVSDQLKKNKKTFEPRHDKPT